jgi:hypothetical protein
LSFFFSARSAEEGASMIVHVANLTDGTTGEFWENKAISHLE